MVMSRSPRTVFYALGGLGLSSGAPLGWLSLRCWQAAPFLGVAQELRAHADLYLYLTTTTAVVFAIFGGALGASSDRLAAAAAALRSLAVTDALTGLGNVRSFQERLATECARASRNQTPLALVFLDLDHFKAVNDRKGHGAGDTVLRALGVLIQGHCRAGDVACRVGGDEFAILCPQTDLEAAAQAAERLRAAIEAALVPIESGLERFTGSLGVATYLRGEPAVALCKRADDALYEAKRRGRNQVVGFTGG